MRGVYWVCCCSRYACTADLADMLLIVIVGRPRLWRWREQYSVAQRVSVIGTGHRRPAYSSGASFTITWYAIHDVLLSSCARTLRSTALLVSDARAVPGSMRPHSQTARVRFGMASLSAL